MKHLLITFLLLTAALSSRAQPVAVHLLCQKWRLSEIYTVDTAQLVYDRYDLSASEHRRAYNFNLAELNVEQRILQFMPSGQSFIIEKSLNFDSHTRQLGQFRLAADSTLYIENDKARIQLLSISPNILVLGKNWTTIEVYSPWQNDLEDLHLPDDYIWEYYKTYFPNRFRRLEEGGF